MLIGFPEEGEFQKLSVVCNTGDGELFSNVESAMKRGLPEIQAYDPVAMPAVICGGGPSLESTLEKIAQMKQHGARIFALNNSAKFLYEHGIQPDVQVIIDSRAKNVDFLEKRWAGEVLLASQCHPDLFDHCEKIGYPVRLWHPIIDGIEKYLKPQPMLVGGGLTVGLSGMCLVFSLGHRHIHLFGYDSCHGEGKSHAYKQPMNDADELVDVAVDGRSFQCSVTMAAQASSFQRIAEMLANHDCEIYVHGDGLIPHIANRMTREVKVLNAVYDLGVSPPTYDFIGFLAEAEKARISGGYTDLDVTFQPGPIGGFRNDNLPPSIEEREGMLHRICVASCRLLPSVRNVTVLKHRQELKGELFPKDYTLDFPLNHYGTRYFKNAPLCLTATAQAKAHVKKHFPMKYVTITLRTSEAWSARNSNEKEWWKVAKFLYEKGIHTIWVRDTNDPTADIYSWDVDMRLALYEGSMMNLGVNNGPMALMYCANVPYMTFKMITKDVHVASIDFLKAHGMNEGDQFGENGKIYWCDDDAENIIPALSEWLNKETPDGNKDRTSAVCAI
jgi:hypothetical protein